MAIINLLAVLPYLGILVGVVFLNRASPFVFGLPMLLGWLVVWMIVTAASIGIIFVLDPANRVNPRKPDTRSPAGS